jgi:ribonuclease HI
MTTNNKKLYIFSDAGSYHNGKPDQLGSCSALIVNEDWELEHKMAKAFDGSTNNFNEIMGVLIGLEYVLNNRPDVNSIEVISDSEYVIKGANERLIKWIKAGWKNSSGPVKNRELWEAMYGYITHCARNRMGLKFTWQRGHSGKNITLEENPIIYYQEKADTLAVLCKEKALLARG